jgi:hypothetical protein
LAGFAVVRRSLPLHKRPDLRVAAPAVFALPIVDFELLLEVARLAVTTVEIP